MVVVLEIYRVRMKQLTNVSDFWNVLLPIIFPIYFGRPSLRNLLTLILAFCAFLF